MQIFWIFTGRLPTPCLAPQPVDRNGAPDGYLYDAPQGWQDSMRLLITCWTTGEKYDLGKFQDLIMLELLEWLQYFEVNFSQETAVLAASHAPTGSKLRKVLAINMIDWVYSEQVCKIEYHDAVLEVRRFASEVMNLKEEHWSNEGRTGEGCPIEVVRKNWRQFMVAGGPTEHWISKLWAEDEACSDDDDDEEEDDASDF